MDWNGDDEKDRARGRWIVQGSLKNRCELVVWCGFRGCDGGGCDWGHDDDGGAGACD